jgi:hypothetical protein
LRLPHVCASWCGAGHCREGEGCRSCFDLDAIAVWSPAESALLVRCLPLQAGRPLRGSSPICFTTFKMPHLTTHRTQINGILPTHTARMPMNFCKTNLYAGKKFSYHSLLQLFNRWRAQLPAALGSKDMKRRHYLRTAPRTIMFRRLSTGRTPHVTNTGLDVIIFAGNYLKKILCLITINTSEYN